MTFENFCHNCSAISHAVLDKWKKSMSSDDVADIDWS